MTADRGVVEDEVVEGGLRQKEQSETGRGMEKGRKTEFGVTLGDDGEVEVRRVGFQKCAW